MSKTLELKNFCQGIVKKLRKFQYWVKKSFL